jgi:hypothetical protein
MRGDLGATQESLLAVYGRAWNTHDPVLASRCFAIDGIREWRTPLPSGAPAGATRLRGRQAIHDAIAELMRVVPDLAIEILGSSYGSDRRVWAEWHLSGTPIADRGRWRADRGVVHATGVAIYLLGPDGFRREILYCGEALFPA